MVEWNPFLQHITFNSELRGGRRERRVGTEEGPVGRIRRWVFYLLTTLPPKLLQRWADQSGYPEAQP